MQTDPSVVFAPDTRSATPDLTPAVPPGADTPAEAPKQPSALPPQLAEPRSGGGIDRDTMSMIDHFAGRGGEVYFRSLKIAVAEGVELPARHAEALARFEAHPELVNAPPQIDQRSTEERQFDNGPMAPANAEDFRLNVAAAAGPGLEFEQVATLDASLREFASDIGLSAVAGGSVMENAIRDAGIFQNLDADGRALLQRTTISQLGQLGVNVPETLRKADALISALADEPSGEFAADFVALGAFTSARGVMALAQAYDRLSYRHNLTARR